MRALARDFDDMADRLDELVGSQRAFVADASHQLRTPLTALRLRLESLDEPAAEADREQLDAAVEETHRLQALVDALLALARADAAAATVVTVDVATVARERCDTWSPLAEEWGVALRYAGPAGAPALALDGALEQILDNLLANALDVSPDATTVTVSVTPGGDVVQTDVDDEGPGLTDEQLARAKDRFWRAPDAPAGGTGLGLAIVDQLARRSGGTVTLGRNDAGGLRVTVILPAAGSAAGSDA